MKKCCICGSDGIHTHRGRVYCDACISKVTIPAEVYSRVVGYLRPVQNWNRGKQQEFAERKTFRVPEALQREEAET